MADKDEIGPRAAVTRAIVKPAYAFANLKVSKAIDRALRAKTTPNIRKTAGIPVRPEYKPWGWLQTTRLFRRHPLRQDDVLVDLGSGSGRFVLLNASVFRCRAAIGVERDAHLHALATRNLREWRPPLRTLVEFVNADALTWELPPAATVFFFYSSFRGEEFRVLVDRVLRSVERSPRCVRFLYANPTEAEFLTNVSEFSLIDVVRSWRPREDWARTVSVYVYEVVSQTRHAAG